MNRTEEKRIILQKEPLDNLKGITFEERRSFEEDPGATLYGKNLGEKSFQENVFGRCILSY